MGTCSKLQVFQPSLKKVTNPLQKLNMDSSAGSSGSLPAQLIFPQNLTTVIICSTLAPKVLNNLTLPLLHKQRRESTNYPEEFTVKWYRVLKPHYTLKHKTSGPKITFHLEWVHIPPGTKWEITQIWNNLVFQFDYADHLMHVWEYEQRYIYAPWDILMYMHARRLIQRGSSFLWDDAHKVCLMYKNVEICAYVYKEIAFIWPYEHAYEGL